MGQRLNAGVTLALDAANLENYYKEIFLNADDPDGIYHHAHKVLTHVTMEIRVFSYECKDAVCFQNLLVKVIDTVQSFVTSGRFTLAVYEWSRYREPPIEQLWLAEVDRSSWGQTSLLNLFIVSAGSPVGLEVTSTGRCEVQNVNWSSNLSADSIVSNLDNTTKTALYSLTGDWRYSGCNGWNGCRTVFGDQNHKNM
jgi:hypothetical protein